MVDKPFEMFFFFKLHYVCFVDVYFNISTLSNKIVCYSLASDNLTRSYVDDGSTFTISGMCVCSNEKLAIVCGFHSFSLASKVAHFVRGRCDDETLLLTYKIQR